MIQVLLQQNQLPFKLVLGELKLKELTTLDIQNLLSWKSFRYDKKH